MGYPLPPPFLALRAGAPCYAYPVKNRQIQKKIETFGWLKDRQRNVVDT